MERKKGKGWTKKKELGDGILSEKWRRGESGNLVLGQKKKKKRYRQQH